MLTNPLPRFLQAATHMVLQRLYTHFYRYNERQIYQLKVVYEIREPKTHKVKKFPK